MVCLGRNTGKVKFYFFDNNWNLLRLNKLGVEAPLNFTLPKPKNMDKMFALAQRLSEGIPFVRIDLYDTGSQIYFGEYTFYPQGGFDKNLLESTNYQWGQLIDLDLVKKRKSHENNRISN